jgi:hypothetical protein
VKIYENQQKGTEKGDATTQKRTSVDLSLHTMTLHERSLCCRSTHLCNTV